MVETITAGKIVLGRCGCGKRGLVVKELTDPPQYYSECCHVSRPAKKCEEMLAGIQQFRSDTGRLPKIKDSA